MKRRLLLSLCVVGAVFSGHTPNLLQTQSPSVSAERVVTARASARLPDHLMLKSTPEARPWFERVAVRSLAMTGEDTPSTSVQPGNGQSAPLPTTSEGSETTAAVTTRGGELGRCDTLGYCAFRSVGFCSYGSLLFRRHRTASDRLLGRLVPSFRSRHVRARLDLCEVLSSGNSRSWPGYCRLASAGKASTKSG